MIISNNHLLLRKKENLVEKILQEEAEDSTQGFLWPYSYILHFHEEAKPQGWRKCEAHMTQNGIRKVCNIKCWNLKALVISFLFSTQPSMKTILPIL